jgi:hypothetical protein
MSIGNLNLSVRLEKKPGQRKDLTSPDVGQGSEYSKVLEDTDTSRQDASRWQAIAGMSLTRAGGAEDRPLETILGWKKSLQIGLFNRELLLNLS